MNPWQDNPSRRIALAACISVLLHGLLLWGPNIRGPQFKSSLPPLTAKLVALPGAGPAKPKHKRKSLPAAQQTAPQASPQTETVVQDSTPEVIAASEPVAASSPVATSEPMAVSAPTVATTLDKTNEAERPLLPKRAQLTFNIHYGAQGGVIGETVHTLEIDNGHYELSAVNKTIGLTKLFVNFQLTQHSSGIYSKYGLQPQQYFEERKESSGMQRNTVEFDRTAQLAHFSNGRVMALPPDTLDFLSNMYQFPPLQGAKMASVSVSDGKKIESYDFEITPDEKIDTPIGKLLTVRLHKMHGPNEEGLDIWLAMEYRLFPVKMRFFERNGSVAAEAVISDIRVSEEEGVRKDAAN